MYDIWFFVSYNRLISIVSYLSIANWTKEYLLQLLYIFYYKYPSIVYLHNYAHDKGLTDIPNIIPLWALIPDTIYNTMYFSQLN